MIWFSVPSPFGPLSFATADNHVVALRWIGDGTKPQSGLPAEVAAQLQAYFEGRLQVFDLPLGGHKTEFSKQFAEAMIAIPYGETLTYGEIAKITGISAQAAGQACGANQIPIIIPCHRVMGTKGLVGYSGAGGVETKVALLQLEGAGSFLI